MKEMIARYHAEHKKWVQAGKPMRSPERMGEIHGICGQCPEFLKGHGMIPGYDMCGKCGCNLHPSHHTLNKIAWATTHCPLEEPEWEADIDPESPGDTETGSKQKDG